MAAAAIPAVAALATTATDLASPKSAGEVKKNDQKSSTLDYLQAGAKVAGGIADLMKPLPARQLVSPNIQTPGLPQAPTTAQSLQGIGGGASPGTPQVTVPQLQSLQTLLAAFGKQGN